MGVKLRSPNTTCFARHARRALEEEHPELLAMIEPSLQVIDAMTEQVRCLEGAIEKLATESYPETEFLRQIPGVGVLTALTFVLTIGDPLRFARPVMWPPTWDWFRSGINRVTPTSSCGSQRPGTPT